MSLLAALHLMLVNTWPRLGIPPWDLAVPLPIHQWTWRACADRIVDTHYLLAFPYFRREHRKRREHLFRRTMKVMNPRRFAV